MCNDDQDTTTRWFGVKVTPVLKTHHPKTNIETSVLWDDVNDMILMQCENEKFKLIEFDPIHYRIQIEIKADHLTDRIRYALKRCRLDDDHTCEYKTFNDVFSALEYIFNL